jgi:AraC-like DNA-binding protein
VNVTLGWIQLATLLGAAQGFLLVGVLLAHRSNRTANRLLATLMATFTLYLVQAVYYSAGMVAAYPAFFGLSYPLPWVFGPLVYLYALAASDGTRRFRARDVLHFLPLLVIVVAGLPIYLMSGPEKAALYEGLQSDKVPVLIRILDPTKYVSGLAYSAATVMYLRRHRRSIENSYSTTERVNLRWLARLTGGVVSIWLLALLIDLAGLLPLHLARNGDAMVGLAIALLVYAIGYMGLRQPEIFHYNRSDDRTPAPTPPDTGPPVATPPSAPSDGRATTAADAAVSPSAERANARYERYERSGLSDVEARSLKAALLALMTRDRPYRDPELTLSALAELLDTTPHKLSEVLNTELSQTFYDFVNSYRVEDVRRRLAASDSKHLNVLTLAMDAGFASKSTFNQVFKKQTGHTPSTYRKVVGAE